MISVSRIARSDSGRSVRVRRGEYPLAVRFIRPSGPLDLPPEAIETTGSREPTAEEILAGDGRHHQPTRHHQRHCEERHEHHRHGKRRELGRDGTRLDRAIGSDCPLVPGLDRLARTLDECGVERFGPEIGADYRQADGVADNPKVVAPESREDEFKIVEVLEPGYRMRGQEDFEVILASKVRINGAWNGENQQ